MAELERRVLALLRERTSPLVPLRELQHTLAAELGDDVADAATLHQRLAGRPDLFFVLERTAPLFGAEDWPPGDRAAYEAALRQAGWEPGPVVGAAGRARGDDGSPASRVAASLAQLAEPSPAAAPLRGRVIEALPLAEASMKALEEAFRAKLEAERGDPVSPGDLVSPGEFGGPGHAEGAMGGGGDGANRGASGSSATS